MLSYTLPNSELQRYCQNDPKFNGVYLWSNLPKIKDGEYVGNDVTTFFR